jgi:polar amino acid transport system permease protein
MRRIVLPQAMRVIVPPTGNELITMLKTTSLVAVIGGTEMFGVAQAIGARDFTTFPMLMVACFWYLVMTSVLSYAQAKLERRFARGTQHSTPPGPGALQRLLGRTVPTRPANQGGAR